MSVTGFVLDVETDGPDTAQHSMFWFGAVVLTEDLTETFEGRLRPIHNTYLEHALTVSGKTREEVLTWPEPQHTMSSFAEWLLAHLRPKTTPQVWSDNPAFDFKWLNLYLDRFSQHSGLLGHSGRNISDRHKGLMEGRAAAGLIDPKAVQRSFTCLRKTPHDHNPMNDAVANAEALLALRQFGLSLHIH